MKSKNIIVAAGIFGGLAVIFGAFGAHALKESLSVDQLTSYKTAVSYQFYHTFLLLALGIISKNRPSRLLKIAAWLTIIGIIFFSGSIYLLTCKDIIGIQNLSWLGPITPVGGLLFIGSWLLLVLNFMKKSENE